MESKLLADKLTIHVKIWRMKPCNVFSKLFEYFRGSRETDEEVSKNGQTAGGGWLAVPTYGKTYRT